jgi:hypothetical protein
MNEFANVKAGIKQPWEVIPTAWDKDDFMFGINPDPKYPGGSAYDPVTRRLFVVQLGADPVGGGLFPLVHVYMVNTITSPNPVEPVAPPITQPLGFSGGTTVGIDTTGANLLVACVSSHATAEEDPSISDYYNNSWTLAVESLEFWDYHMRLYYSVPTSVGSGHTFTVAGVGSQTSINVTAWSGATAAPLDQTAWKGVGGTSIQPGPVTPTLNDELVISCLTNTGDSSNTNRSIDGNFTISGQVGTDYTNYTTAIAGAYLVQTTKATANPTWSYPLNNTANAVIATFKRSGQ